MKHLITLLLFIPLFCFSQESLEQQLDSVSTQEQATQFLKENKPKKGKIFTFNKEKHKTRLANDLFNLSEGGKKVIRTDFKKTFYKVIDKSEIDFIKFSIIVFDAADEEAISKRDKVLAQYREGYRFKDLAKHNSIGRTANKGGDTGWIKAGEMSTAFDEEAFNKSHAVDEIFAIDDVENQKYYLVIKTEDRTPIKVITVLKFTENIE